MIASAFEKQLDNLFRAEAMDISSDIDVLETMLAAEGLTQPNFQSFASMNTQERPDQTPIELKLPGEEKAK